MPDVSIIDNGTYVGVATNPDGTSDFSTAAKVIDPTETQRRVREIHFQKVLADAQRVGLDEDKLRMLVQALATNNNPLRRGSVLSPYVREYGLTPDSVLSLARRYQKERVRLSENGNLIHYHQTSMNGFESAAKLGGLMSYNNLKALGKAPKSSGSRPDVVLLTRDKFDSEGNLRESGLAKPESIGVVGEVALVFDESIMDLPAYDCINFYPNLPSVPFNNLQAVLISTAEDRERVLDVVQRHNLRSQVATREEWDKSNYPENTSS